MLEIDIAYVGTWLLEDVVAKDLVTGNPVDISADQVDVALVKKYETPTDWVLCAWSTKPNALLIPFNLPGGFDLNTLGPGDYWPAVRIHDDPDEPVIYSATPVRVTSGP